MAWQTPKTNWGQSGQTVPIADDFNRIEGNIQHLQDTKAAGAELDAHKAEIATEDTLGHIKLSDMTKGSSKIIPIPNNDTWVCPGWLIYLCKDFTLSQDSIYYVPIYLAEETHFSEVGIYTSGTSGTSVELALYDFNANNLPENLIENFGTVDTSTSGMKSILIDLTLPEGYYYVACRIIGGSLSLRIPDVAGPIVPPVSGVTALDNGSPNNCIPVVTNGSSMGSIAQPPTDIRRFDYNPIRFKL